MIYQGRLTGAGGEVALFGRPDFLVRADLLLAGITGWIQLFGMVSFELSGQFNNVIEARAEFFGLQMEVMADLIGL